MVTLCKNCKYFQPADDYSWEDNCRNDICFRISDVSIITGALIKERISNYRDLNRSLQCNFYVRKWWKFWIKDDR